MSARRRRRPLRRVLRWVGAVAALLVAVPLLWAALHPTLATRLSTYPFDAPVTNVEWYEPREAVPGAEPPRPLPRATAEEAGVDEAALDEAARYAERIGSSALLVLVDGRVVLERYFSGHGPGSTSNAFSMAKTVLALLVGIAIEEGAIGSVGDPVSRYVTEWRGDDRARVTIEDLLLMQSGLRNDDAQWNPLSDLVGIHMGPDLLRVLLRIPAAEPPGRRFDYNNMGSQILALALERATGERYARYLSTRLWSRIGASDASVWLDREGGSAKAYCCLFATATDWARVGELIRLGGRVEDEQVVPESWVRRMQVPSPLEPTYGYHVWLYREEGDEALSYTYLDGKLRQRVYVVSSARAVIVRLGEDPSSWDETLLPRLVAR